MRFVGFPDGLHGTDESMQRWFQWIVSARPLVNEFAIFEEGEYCGESFYEIDKEHGNTASLDIKLFAFARGRGIATKALLQTIEEALRNGAEKNGLTPIRRTQKPLRYIKDWGSRKMIYGGGA